MRNALALILLLAVVAGCQGGASEAEGYKADDFKAKPKPEGFGPSGAGPSGPPKTGG